ncbi:hypothetical protein HY357_00650 [Candidatus Roizmanbacteria bacterium]|nr:hypothetical protein [Candidatus Roizmanbacteria bacterium]
MIESKEFLNLDEYAEYIKTTAKSLGVGVSQLTIDEIRRGKDPGTLILDRIASAQVLKANDSSKKDRLYANITDVGCSVLSAYNIPEEFTSDLASNFNFSTHWMEKILRAMRLDFSFFFSGEDGWKYNELRRTFLEEAADFIDEKSPYKKTSDTIRHLQDQWTDKTNVQNYYHALYTAPAPNIIGYWLLRELPSLWAYYEMRQKHKLGLDPFSKMLLQDYMKGVKSEKTIERIQNHLGSTTFDRGLLPLARNIVVYGQPTLR